MSSFGAGAASAAVYLQVMGPVETIAVCGWTLTRLEWWYQQLFLRWTPLHRFFHFRPPGNVPFSAGFLRGGILHGFTAALGRWPKRFLDTLAGVITVFRKQWKKG
jgi:hypothetical protein